MPNGLLKLAFVGSCLIFKFFNLCLRRKLVSWSFHLLSSDYLGDFLLIAFLVCRFLILLFTVFWNFHRCTSRWKVFWIILDRYTSFMVRLMFVFSGKTLHSHRASLHPGVEIGSSKLLWVQPDKMLGGNLPWTSIPSRASRNTPSRYEISARPGEPSNSPNYDWDRLFL